MADKQLPGLYAPDGSKYGTLVDGSGELIVASTSVSENEKQHSGSQAPDGSIYFCLTDGEGSTVLL